MADTEQSNIEIEKMSKDEEEKARSIAEPEGGG